ncbi:hypothetical protein L210DRAFT_944038 [Boletus edulis BED1]|uniref:Uncharacterized protein n=1 Tax=Boletus edulis BED1 TaxID=1328754 RepID=A0AAD4GK53_BOLED|nr:hypothetical protein L210DRAFT_944038 [Boletus edulis BED1]
MRLKHIGRDGRHTSGPQQSPITAMIYMQSHTVRRFLYIGSATQPVRNVCDDLARYLDLYEDGFPQEIKVEARRQELEPLDLASYIVGSLPSMFRLPTRIHYPPHTLCSGIGLLLREHQVPTTDMACPLGSWFGHEPVGARRRGHGMYVVVNWRMLRCRVAS